MLTGIAVALVLAAPVPAPRPAAGMPAVPATLTAPARASGIPMPIVRPVRPATDLNPGTVDRDERAALELSSPGEAGMVCRDPRLAGEELVSFTGPIPGCGIIEPVRVSAVGGIPLSSPIKVNCRTARKFADWLIGVASPVARKELGSGIAAVRLYGSYSCRTRNNQRGARLSEHSVGRAIDFAGVTLVDGRRIRVRDDWGRGRPGTFLKRIWKGACGIFTTVIGPNGDSYHQTHLHLDAAYRHNPWCE